MTPALAATAFALAGVSALRVGFPLLLLCHAVRSGWITARTVTPIAAPFLPLAASDAALYALLALAVVEVLSDKRIVAFPVVDLILMAGRPLAAVIWAVALVPYADPQKAVPTALVLGCSGLLLVGALQARVGLHRSFGWRKPLLVGASVGRDFVAAATCALAFQIPFAAVGVLFLGTALIGMVLAGQVRRVEAEEEAERMRGLVESRATAPPP